MSSLFKKVDHHSHYNHQVHNIRCLYCYNIDLQVEVPVFKIGTDTITSPCASIKNILQVLIVKIKQDGNMGLGKPGTQTRVYYANVLLAIQVMI